MELETFVFGLSIALQAVGLASVIACSLTRCPRRAMNAEIVMIGCLCGLGSATILGAILHHPAGLMSGVALVFVGVALIFLIERHTDENPFSAEAT